MPEHTPSTQVCGSAMPGNYASGFGPVCCDKPAGHKGSHQQDSHHWAEHTPSTQGEVLAHADHCPCRGALLSLTRELEAARQQRDAAIRLIRGKYLPWSDAGGPNECKHGRAEGIACQLCDAALVRAFDDAQQSRQEQGG